MSEPVIQASPSPQPALKRLDAQQSGAGPPGRSPRAGGWIRWPLNWAAANEEESLKAVAASLGLEFVELTSTKPDLGLLRDSPSS